MSENAHWSARPEGGSRFAIWLMLTVGLYGGRGLARLILYPVTLYFYFRRPYERRVSYAFLERATGEPACAWQVMRHMHRFAGTMLDRAFLLGERYKRFDVKIHGFDELASRMRQGRGVLLLGAHVGSFEVLRVATVGHPEVKLRVVLDTQKTPALTELLHALNPDIGRTVIDASRPGSEIVLALAEALGEGALATLLADRAKEGEATMLADFFGQPAPFPTAPFLLGAILKVPLVTCLGLYRGGSRYDLYFEPLADELVVPRGQREAALREAVQRYASILERHVRDDPYNWFNWHDFWNPEGRGVEPAAGRAVDAGRVARGNA